MKSMRTMVAGVLGYVAGGLSVAAVVVSPALLNAQQKDARKFWKESSPPITGKEASSAPSAPASSIPSLSGLVKTVSPAVVYIQTARAGRNPHAGMPFDFGPFGMPPGRLPDGSPQQSTGSGFIISEDGYIVTNNHVVADTTEVKVRLDNGKEYVAKVVGVDPQIDVGLIKIEAKGLMAVDLGDSEKLEPGDWVLAMGNPLGFDHSASVGIISGKAREIGIGRYDALLQTDAAINPGNSGGPLFNLRGEVVGINTAIIGGANNIGFAVPINMAKDVLPDLRESGRAIRGQLGVFLAPVTDEAKEAMGLTSKDGALVQRVIAGSPADKAGLQPGDVITKIDGKPVVQVKELQRQIAGTRPGSEIKLTYQREGKSAVANAKLIEFKEDTQLVARGDAEPRGETSEKLGLVVSDITPGLMTRYKIREPNGVLVTGVHRGSVADEAGLEQGDVIVEANRRKVSSAEEFRKVVQGSAGKPVMLLIERDGEAQFLVVSPKRSSER